MIYPSLPPASYTETLWFDLERERLFREHWILVGMTQQLPSENCYITREVGGIPVLVQKIGGQLRAFKNACPHRLCPIQTGAFGNRKLLCPYHGWSFGQEGRLRGIPLGTGYNFSEEDKVCMDLQTYPLEAVGDFLFVNVSATPKPISWQFSDDMLLLLTELSRFLSREVSYTSWTGKYNWKLNYENIIEGEGQHVPFVHQTTLAPSFKSEGSPVPPSHLFRPDGPLGKIHLTEMPDWAHSPIPGLDDNGKPKKIDVREVSDIKRRRIAYTPRWHSERMESCDRGWYFACHIFPNVNVSITSGEWCFLEQFSPLAPDRTEYHSWAFSARLKEGVRPMPHLLWGFHHNEKRVVDEDVVVFEEVQKVLASRPDNAGYLGENERTLAAFGRYYLQCLKKGEDYA